jgi:hypothetical protein
MINKVTKTLIGSVLLAAFLGQSHETKSIDSNTKKYYNKFMRFAEECKIKVDDSNLRIELNEDIQDRLIGICYYELNLIDINPRSWKRTDDNIHEQTILHELSHCLLQQKHDDQGLNIMNTKGFIPEDTYHEYYDYFIRRLFKDCKKPLTEKFTYEI